MGVSIRKVQKFGRSTLMVSLPADWVKRVGLSRGDSVRIEILEDDSIRIVPLSVGTKEKEEKVLLIKVGKVTSENLLMRAIVAAYVLGMDKVVVEASEGFLSQPHMNVIKDVKQRLIGAEIIEHTPERVTLSILIDPMGYRALDVMARMADIVYFMVSHIAAALQTGSQHFLSEVLELENEVDKLHALIVRQLIVAQRDRMLMRHLKIRPHMVTEYRGIVKALEEVADALSRAAETLMEGGIAVTKRSSELIRTCIEELQGIVSDVTEAVKDLRVDGRLSTVRMHNTLDRIGNFRSTIVRSTNEKIYKLFREAEDKSTYLILRDFMDRLGEVAAAAEAIAEILFDITVETVGDTLDISKEFP